MPGSAVDPRDLRVSDAERAHVMSLLEKATGRGLISLAEFDERSATVVTAKTRAELNAVLLDLPGLVVSGRSEPIPARQAADPAALSFAPPVTGPPGWPAPGGAAGGPGAPYDAPGASFGPSGQRVPALKLTGWGNRDLRGFWVVPDRIVIGGYAGATRLDMSQAQLTSRTVRIEFTGNRYGSLEVIVPPGTSVRLDELEMRGGGVDNRVPPGSATGALELVLAGEKRGGWIVIRHPRRRLLGGWA
ncbi:MAG TPA: DUF1707 domain-containing protein [Nakamurella sp.]|nr:DUF1707 domain-containing protein [Nakamurella sp.]